MYLLNVLLIAPIIVAVLGKETVRDAATIARNLIYNSSSSVGVMATIYPNDHPALPAQPFAMQEYYASCHSNGSLTLLFLPISRHSQNILHSSKHAASISISSQLPAARNPRVALIGHVTIFTNTSAVPERAAIQRCYLDKHPDARWWLPDDDRAAHISYWARFDPDSVYFVGGFGDNHYIGYIPLEMYQGKPVLDGLRGHNQGGLFEQY